jgi:hypothetical protein
MHAIQHDLGLSSDVLSFYSTVLDVLERSEIPFMLGGAYAFASYTGILRHTKDLDVFIKPSDVARALKVFDELGYQTDRTEPIWLSKVYAKAPVDAFVDFIYRSGNGISEVDDDWFRYATPVEAFGHQVLLCAPEETIWSKAFVMERHRYDGPDVAHYMLSWSKQMDWDRLVMRFGEHWRVLFSYMVLFGFIYPDRRSDIPDRIMDELTARLQAEQKAPASTARICNGTLTSRFYFLPDVETWERDDARFTKRGSMTDAEVDEWRQHFQTRSKDMMEEVGIIVASERSPEHIN